MYRQKWHIPPEEKPNAYANDARFHLRIQHQITPEKLKRGFVQVESQVTGTDELLIDEFYSQLHASGTAERIESVVEDINEQPAMDATFHNRPELVYKKIVYINHNFEFEAGDGYVTALRAALEKLTPIVEIMDDVYEETVATKL